jgi:hypothetical protein
MVDMGHGLCRDKQIGTILADEAGEPDPTDRLLATLLPADAEKIMRHRAWVGQIAGLWAAFEHSIDGFAITLAGIPAEVGIVLPLRL